ncbi:hypothetical protein CkaCkLH20_10207 [Colletotrichum karsti]|uniref:Ketoreductase domain-containing protein n=1 Tax=Colletotrichum karsti TaxID=1095194 RepID=A0A9P6I5I6_9PEZI|nr:uncharacterized protein CkaCkLH20_10207 [Colletotrichum karsti]KAF9872380.1 hypothetical protein CkaCkLH20_10207 [Colletotrichum karsti]
MSNVPIALVTGANAGLGRAIAEILATQHSYHVIIGSRDIQKGQETETSLRAKGLSVSTVQLDLISDDSIHAAVSEITKQNGRLDVLVNNAAVHLEIGPSDLSLRDRFRSTFETNVFGTAVLTEACVPLLRQAESPRVVFVGSASGSMTRSLDKEFSFYGAEFAAYKASKAAMNNLSMRYVVKLEDVGGMVNVVCPGLVKTKMVNFTSSGVEPEVAALKVVEMATLEKGGPTGTFVDANGEVPW